jgi:glycosyltransferase involved in cell wall biosynthesis
MIQRSKALFIGSSRSLLAINRCEALRQNLGNIDLIFFNSTPLGRNFFIKNKFIVLMSKILFYAFGFIRLYFAIKFKKIKTIHFHGAYHFVFNFIPLFVDAKVIVTPQGSEINEEYRGYVAHIVLFLFKRANIITVKSSFMEKLVLQKGRCIAPDTIQKLNWGIDDAIFESRRDFKNGPGIKIISFRATGKLYNTDIIFTAVTRLKQKYPFVEFTYVEFNNMLELNLDLSVCDAVHNNLSAGDIAKLVSQQDVMISIPSHDGFSTSIMESLAVGILPVISDIDSYKDEFVDPRIVKKVSPINADALFETLDVIVKNIVNVRADGKNRVAFARENYSKSKQMRIARSIYENLLH